MNCPRCRSALEQVEVAGFQAHLCGKCEGAWFEGKGPAVLRDVPQEVLEKSPLAPTLVAEERPEVALAEPIQCPLCHHEMNRYKYLSEGETWVDFCSQHGMWLDDGELPQVLASLRLEPELETAEARRLPTALQRLAQWFHAWQR